MKTIAIVGVGLIGGSFALRCRSLGWAHTIIGVDNNSVHAAEALKRGLVDQMASLEEAVSKADLIVLAIPVNAVYFLEPILPQCKRLSGSHLNWKKHARIHIALETQYGINMIC